MIKKLLSLFKSKAFLYAFCLLLALLASVLFYIYAPLLAFDDIYIFASPFVRIFIILALWAIAFFTLLFKPLKEFLQSLKNEEKEQLNEIKREQKTILSRMKRNYHIALNEAKSTWKKTLNLKEVPLVVVIGNEGAGKSSFINYSDMQYPISESLESYKKLHKSTNNFGFYIAQNGALIDTEGNYFSQETFFKPDNTDEIAEDNIEKNKDFILKKQVWNKFLSFLNKKSFHSKLNGIVLVIDAALFLNNPKSYIDDTIDYLTKRVDECESALNLKLPIYLVFSKIDLLEGMGEYWRIFSEHLSNRVLGLTLNTSFDRQALESDFQALSNSLLYTFMSKNSSLHSRAEKNTAFLFLKQLDMLFALSIEFLTLADKKNTLKNKSHIRGVYFTSAYQENVPRNHLLDAICDKYEIKKPPAKSATKQHRQSYFVRPLLENIILRDSHLSSVIFRNFWSSLKLGALVLGSCILAYTLSAYFVHKSYKEVHKSDIAFYNIQALLGEGRHYEALSLTQKATLMLNLKAILATYPSLFKDANPMQYPTLNIAYKGFVPAKDLYAKLNNDVISNTLVHEMQHILQESQDPTHLLETLYMYLALSSEKHVDRALLSVWVEKNWRYFEQYQIPQEDFLAGIEDLALVDFEQYLSHEDIALAHSQGIERAREMIAQLPKQQRIYALIAFCHSVKKQEFYSLKDAIGGSFTAIFENPQALAKIDKIYTRDGLQIFLSKLEDDINHALEIQSWVLNDPTQERDREKLPTQILSIHLAHYKQKWQDLLTHLTPKAQTNKEALLGELQILAFEHNPLNTLANIVSENTYLNDAVLLNFAYALGFPSADIKTQFATLTRHFEPYHIFTGKQSFIATQIASLGKKDSETPKEAHILQQENLAKDVQSLLEKISDFSKDNTKDMQAKMMYILEGGDEEGDPFKQLAATSQNLPPAMTNYYRELLDMSWLVIEQNAKELLNNAWKKEIYSVFVDEISPFYPFNAYSADSIPMSSFKAFFGNQGTLQTFYQQYLGKILLKRGTSFYLAPQYQSKFKALEQFIPFLNAMQGVGAIFDSNNNLSLSFVLVCVDLSSDFGSVDIGYNDKLLHYDHTLNERLFIIPEQFNASTELRFVANDYNQNPQYNKIYSGEWAWFRFLKDMRPSQNGQNSLHFEGDKRWYFDFALQPNKFELLRLVQLISTLKLPQTIM